MVLKYVVPGYPFPTLWFGVANVIANSLVMLRYEAHLDSLTTHILTEYEVPLCFGLRRIWKTNIPIT